VFTSKTATMELNGELYFELRLRDRSEGNPKLGCWLCSKRKYKYMQDREEYDSVMTTSTRYPYYHIPCFQYLFRIETGCEYMKYLFANPGFVPKLYTLSMTKISYDDADHLHNFDLPKYNRHDDLYEFQ
jgi:hypothetical protein